MQADGGLVEDVEHAHEAGADLRGEPDALRLATRERRGRAGEREVVEADVDHEAQALPDLLDDGAGDEELALVEVEPLEEGEAVAARHGADLVDVLVADRHGEKLGLEPRPVAGRAGHLADVLLEVRLHGLRRRLLVLVKEDLADARVRREPVRVAAVARDVVDADLRGAEAVEKDVLRLLGQVRPGGLVRDADVFADGGEDLRVVVRVPEEAAEDAFGDREGRVLDEGGGVDDLAEAEAVAVGAGAVGGVEGEVAGLEVVDGVAVLGAGEGERVLEQLAGHALGVVPVGQEVDADLVRGELGGLLDRLGDAARRVLVDDDAVDDDLDGVLELLLELDVLLEVADLAVHADAGEALLLEVGEELGVLALAAEHDGREHERPSPLAGGEDLVGDLVRGLALDHATALGAVRDADAGEEEAEVVVDLGDGAHGRAGVARGRLLVDGDRGREPVDRVEVGLVHLAEELPRVAREALDVATLALGVDRVEGEARLARARQSRDHDELVAGDVDVHVGEVVLAGAADDYGVVCHAGPLMVSNCDFVQPSSVPE